MNSLAVFSSRYREDRKSRYQNILFILLGIVILVFIFFDNEITGQVSNNTKTSTEKLDNLDSISGNGSISSGSNSYLQNKNNFFNDDFNTISVDILSDRKAYTEFEDISIYVKIFGNQLDNQSELVKLILEERNSTNSLIHRSSQTVNVDNYEFLLHPASIGKYNVTVTAIQGNNSESASTTFDVVSIFETNIAKFLYLGIALFGALMFLITVGLKNNLVEEILRFICLTGIVVSILASLLFSDLQFGTSSPIGLIKVKASDGQDVWVFNVGNTLNIPIYVVVFGLIGGYLRYLYKTSTLIDVERKKGKKVNISDKNQDESAKNMKSTATSSNAASENQLTYSEKRREIFFESLHDIMLFALSPLLAIVAYFLLHVFGLSGPNSIFTLAVVSFSVGLTTEEVIQTLTRFVKDQLAKNKGSKNETPKPKENDD